MKGVMEYLAVGASTDSALKGYLAERAGNAVGDGQYERCMTLLADGKQIERGRWGELWVWREIWNAEKLKS